MHTVSVAPMLDYTDRHFRYFFRLISKKIGLYTEMITTQALLQGDTHRHLQFHAIEHPVSLQLGGSQPQDLARCAQLGADYGYDAINLNIGCPSARVQEGRMGACLMADPDRVAQCVFAMQQVVKIPVTVKTRIGIDDDDSYEFLYRFIHKVAQAGCKTFIIHARKAWLSGLSPKENRTVPPLFYERVARIKKDFPSLTIVINGGIKTISELHQHLQQVDGVMIGREAYANPYYFAEIDQKFFHSPHVPLSRYEVLRRFVDYAQAQCQSHNQKLKYVLRHLVGLYQGVPGARGLRGLLSRNEIGIGEILDRAEDMEHRLTQC